MRRVSFTSPAFTYLVILILIATVVVYVLSERSVRSRIDQTQIELQELRWDLDERGVILEIAFNDFNDVLDHLSAEYLRDDEPISPGGLAALDKATHYFEEFISRNRENQSMKPAIARAYHLLGRVYSQRSEVMLAEAVYRESRRLFSQLEEQDGQHEAVFRRAENDAYLCRLLAAMGRAREAFEISAEVQARLEKLMADFPGESSYRSALADALNNHALLSQAVGQPSDVPSLLGRSQSLLDELASSDAEYRNGHLVRLIDTQQILAGFLARTGRLQSAIDACAASSKSIDELYRNNNERKTITFELESAKQQVDANRRRLEARLALPQPSDAPEATFPPEQSQPAPIADWAWRPLAGRSGKTIPADVLVRGRAAGEFEHHDALLMSFAWESARWWRPMLVAMIKAACQRLQIVVLVPDERAEDLLLADLIAADVPRERVYFVRLATNGIWTRDYGPLPIQTDADVYRWVDSRYGDERLRDDHVPRGLAHRLRIPTLETPLKIQYGNIIANGRGICLTTTRLLSENKELGFSEDQITEELKRVFGASQVVYLDALEGEGTGHVDWFATFVTPDTVVVGDYTGIDPAKAKILDENARRLGELKTPAGPLNVVRIPMPARSKELPGGTYTNVVYANGVLLVPTWGNASAETESHVMASYRRLLPDWEVIAIDASTMEKYHGALRCGTMQLNGLSAWPQRFDETPAAVPTSTN